MKDLIIENLNNPKELERLFRERKNDFTLTFRHIYPDLAENPIAQVWHERLNYDKEEISLGSGKDLLFVVIAGLIAGALAKFPDLTGIDPEYFYPRNIGFIVFPFLSAYFLWKNELSLSKIITITSIFLISAIYINILPNNPTSDTLILAAIHLPLFLWSVFGASYSGKDLFSHQKRIRFLKFNGELLVIMVILILAGVLLTFITLGLFELIDLNIEEFYMKNIAIWGLAAIPILGTFLVRTNPQLVNKVSPLIAKVFTPFVLLMLVVYLIAVIISGKDPYNDRDFLLIFNILLIGVMALILFSVAENSSGFAKGSGRILLLALALVTIIINLIALSAIVFRINEWGITPNRLAVLGSNVLILINLIQVNYRLFGVVNGKAEAIRVENSIAAFLPYYAGWTILVSFGFPILFGFE
jgi:hypothetical protein